MLFQSSSALSSERYSTTPKAHTTADLGWFLRKLKKRPACFRTTPHSGPLKLLFIQLRIRIRKENVGICRMQATNVEHFHLASTDHLPRVRSCLHTLNPTRSWSAHDPSSFRGPWTRDLFLTRGAIRRSRIFNHDGVFGSHALPPAPSLAGFAFLGASCTIASWRSIPIIRPSGCASCM